MSPSLDPDGWTLASAEAAHARTPQTFLIPDRARREALTPGDAAKLLFDIQTREGGRIHRGIDRMWVIVKKRIGDTYVGVLDNDPGLVEGVNLRPGTEVRFLAEHVADIAQPPAAYVLEKYGEDFFDL